MEGVDEEDAASMVTVVDFWTGLAVIDLLATFGGGSLASASGASLSSSSIVSVGRLVKT